MSLRSATARVGVIGLGTGSIACYSKPGERWTFYEIDPTVERIARDPRLFTYLRVSPGELDVVLGGARLSLVRAPDRRYGLIVADAFSSDWRRVAIRVAGIGRLVVGVGAVHGPAKGGSATGRNPTAREGAPASPKGLKARSPVRQRAGLPAPTPASAGFGLGQELGG